MKRAEKGRGLFHTRDSGGRHENTPAEYVNWAIRTASDMGINFTGTPAQIERMIRQEEHASGDIFLDFDVKGNVLLRRGLDALTQEAMRDLRVSHIFIPRRDRLARPDTPMEGVQLENGLRELGLTIVFMNKIVGPLFRRQRPDIGESIVAMIDYHQSGEDRRGLAEKVLFAQLRLAKLGYSTGGRPPYGFRRWLVREDGTLVRELAAGEYVRMQGHHVVWLPGPDEEMGIIRRILRMLETMPAMHVARILTQEGIPSPDAGRCRTDNGVRHEVSGDWHQPAIINIARNPLLLALSRYGLRSMGDQLRFTADGPRQLMEDDYRSDQKPKVTRNAEDQTIKAPAHFEPLVDPERHAKLMKTLDVRAGSQKGIPRSHDPAKNPLGCRVFDMNCGWTMYRQPYNDSFRYTCGLYQQSHGVRCASNHVPGESSTRFVLTSLSQRILSPSFWSKLEDRLRMIAQRELESDAGQRDRSQCREQLSVLENELALVRRNLARAKSDDEYDAISEEYDDLKKRHAQLHSEVEDAQMSQPGVIDPETEIAAALDLGRRLSDLVAEDGELERAHEIVELVNARLFFRFQPVKPKKRTVNRICSGVLIFGDAEPPIKIYSGPTARMHVKPSSETIDGELRTNSPPKPPEHVNSGEEGESLGNSSRGDRI